MRKRCKPLDRAPVRGSFAIAAQRFSHTLFEIDWVFLRAAFAALLACLIPLTALAQEEEPSRLKTAIVVGSELDYPPFALVTEDGQADGFSVDLMKAVCEVMGIEVTFRVGPWNQVRRALEVGQVDALPLVSYSEDRERVFDFTAPHTVSYGMVFKRRDSPDIDDIEDLRGKAVIAMRADATHDWLLENQITDRLVLVKTVADALRLLASGRHDYALIPRLVGLLTAKSLNLNNLETTGPKVGVYGRGYGFAVTEGDYALLQQLNQGLAIVKETGQYDAIYEKWFGIVDPAGVPTETIIRYATWSAAGVAALAALVMAWIISLRSNVARRTRELADEQNRLQEIIWGTNAGTWIWDVRSNQIWFNDRWAEIVGHRTEELEPITLKTWTSRCHPEDFKQAKRLLKQTFSGENDYYHCETRLRHRDNHWVWGLLRGRVVEWSADGKPLRMSGTLTDITDQKTAEIALQKLSLAVEQSPSSVMITDPGGRLEYVNPKFERLTGYTMAEVVGRNPRFLGSGEKSREEYHELWETILAGKDWHGEFHNKRKDGSLYWESATISPIKSPDGKITNFLAVKEDITELRAAEETLRRTQRLKAVGQLTGGIAHDFNNLLAIIMGNAELIDSKFADNEELLRHVAAIKQASKRGASLTQRLLAFSRQTKLAPVITDSAKLVESLEDMLRRTLGETIELRIERAVNLWPAKIDPYQFENALINLAINARDAMPEGGELLIKVDNVTLTEAYAQQQEEVEPGDYVRVRVIDTGGGMTDDVARRAFEPFFTTKGIGLGSGLGLSMVYGFVKQSDGHITIESEIDQGTTIDLFLPRAADREGQKAEPQEMQQAIS